MAARALPVTEKNLSDATDRTITVTEMAAMDQPIAVRRETTAAIVGRALRGPLNEPVLLTSFGDFRRHFGDSWSRSSLGPAVQQFFAHGGQRVYVVRVANRARGAMLCLPAAGSALVLRALQPGSSEQLRAAVDYDGVAPGDQDTFNLTLQRMDPVSGLILDQEIHKAISYRADAGNFVATVLQGSAMVRVDTPLPTHRPEPTAGPELPFDSSYVGHSQAGSDGEALSDYDLIGSSTRRTGLFALEKVARFDLLYLPPPAKHCDLGMTSLLVAERFCRQRGAMLVVDPPAAWTSPAAALSGIRDVGLASPNLIAYYPRMRERDTTSDPARAVGGALTGLLCKLDRNYGPWESLENRGLAFARSLAPALDLSEDQQHELIRAGLNVVATGLAGAAGLHGSVTLSRSSPAQRLFASLSVRRLCLLVLRTLEDATGWAVFEVPNQNLAERVRMQVSDYFSRLAELGAFADDHYIVECDAGLRQTAPADKAGIAIFIAFHPAGAVDPVSFTLHQSVSGCRVSTTAFGPVEIGQQRAAI